MSPHKLTFFYPHSFTIYNLTNSHLHSHIHPMHVQWCAGNNLRRVNCAHLFQPLCLVTLHWQPDIGQHGSIYTTEMGRPSTHTFTFPCDYTHPHLHMPYVSICILSQVPLHPHTDLTPACSPAFCVCPCPLTCRPLIT